ncbi:MAG: 2-oxoglutarate dehydrogenase E1 component, partial [Gammaproteobacteria bacterium]
MSQSLKHRYAWSPLFGSNAPYVEELYEAYLGDTSSVSPQWQGFFTNFGTEAPTQGNAVPRVSHRQLQAVLATRRVRSAPVARPAAAGSSTASEKQAAVSRLIQIYGLRGHQVADLDPLRLTTRRIPAVFKFDNLGLSEA